jgi:hypothetical protein
MKTLTDMSYLPVECGIGTALYWMFQNLKCWDQLSVKKNSLARGKENQKQFELSLGTV